MNVNRGEIIRFVLVKLAFGYPSWYYDELDDAEKGDLVLHHMVLKNLLVKLYRL